MKSAIFSILTGRWWLAFFTLICVAAGVDTMVGQLNGLLDGGAGTAAADIALEEDIALILVGFGVWLEERELFLSKLFADSIPHSEEARNEDAESYGAYLLMLGLAMELLDQLDGVAGVAGPSVQILAIWLMILMHAAGILLLLRFLWIAAVAWGRAD